MEEKNNENKNISVSDKDKEKQATRNPHLKIFKYLLRHGKVPFKDIIKEYSAREEHTYLRNAKNEMRDTDQTIKEYEGEIIEINYVGDYKIFKDKDIRNGLLGSEVLDEILTPNAKPKQMTFFEAYKIMRKIGKMYPKNLITKYMRNPQYTNTILKYT